MPMIAMLIGAVLGMLLLVNVFRLLAGVTFQSWRHVMAAYLEAAIAAIFIYAVNSAADGIPDLSLAPIQWLGALIAALMELALVRQRRAVTAPLPGASVKPEARSAVQRGFHRIGMVGLVPCVVLAAGLLAFACHLWLTASYESPIHASLLGIAALACGGLWYLASWALGWIVAGFSND